MQWLPARSNPFRRSQQSRPVGDHWLVSSRHLDDESSLPSPSTLVITAAIFAVAYTSGGQCVTSIGNFTQITPYFTATKSRSAGAAQFTSWAASEFAYIIGQSQCHAVIASHSDTGNVVQSSLTIVSDFAIHTAVAGSVLRLGSKTSPSSSATSVVTGSPAPAATNSKTKKTLAVGGKIAIGLAVLWPLLIITGLASFRLLHRRRRAKKALGIQSTPLQNEQPYLQQQGELEAEEQMRHELRSESMKPELARENEIHVLGQRVQRLAIKGAELRGEEHFKAIE